MAIRFIRECISGEWMDIRLSDEEITKMRQATIRSAAKCLQLVRAEAATLAADAAHPVQLSPAEVLVLLQKVAPTYSDVVSDYIRGKIWAKKNPTPQPAAAGK